MTYTIATWCEDLSVNTAWLPVSMQRQRQRRQQQVWSDSHSLFVNLLYLWKMPTRGPTFPKTLIIHVILKWKFVKDGGESPQATERQPRCKVEPDRCNFFPFSSYFFSVKASSNTHIPKIQSLEATMWEQEWYEVFYCLNSSSDLQYRLLL